jgi:shikimate dehydrogenase
LQAVEQFALYTGIRPDDEAVALAATFAHGAAVAEKLGAGKIVVD